MIPRTFTYVFCYLVLQSKRFYLSAYEVKNNNALFERLFKVKKNGVFLFGISFFVLEIFRFLYYANDRSDDVTDRSTKTIKYWIKNISRNNGAVIFKLGTSNVHHKRNKMTAVMLLPWQQSCRWPCFNRPRSIYQYSSMAPRLSGQNCKFFTFLLSLNSQRRLRYKENNTKYRNLTWKPRSHVRILIYRTSAITTTTCHVIVLSERKIAWQMH